MVYSNERAAFLEETMKLYDQLEEAEKELKKQQIKINILKAKIYGLKNYPIESE